MSKTNTTGAETMSTNPMTLQDLIYSMIDSRREFAADNGMTVTDEEIAYSVKASLARMMEEAGK
jgi:hypothetical protein